MTKHYICAPLPFVGQKRNFIKEFKRALSRIPDQGQDWTIIDVFGGSGLLAHTAKRCKPEARVIYNDFDGYAERLRHIPDTNRLRRLLADSLATYPRDIHLDKPTKQRILDIIQAFDGYKDLPCLRSWLLFSSNQAKSLDDLYGKHFYNCIRKSDYETADGYLDGLEIVCESFDSLMSRYQSNPQTLLILDPPYVSTNQDGYKNSYYFGMVQFLRLMALVKPPFIFFSSTRSELLEYVGFLKHHRPDEWMVWSNAQWIKFSGSMAAGVIYEDNMAVNFG